MNSKFLSNPSSKAIWFGCMLFIALTVAKFISGGPVTYKTFLPGLAGGLVAGLVVYFLSKYFLKKSKS